MQPTRLLFAVGIVLVILSRSAGAAIYSADADTFTLNGEVTWLDNRILVYGPGQDRQPSAGFVQFPTDVIDTSLVQSATLRIWLSEDTANPENVTTTATIIADSSDGWDEASMVEGGWSIGGGGTPFVPDLGSESATALVAGGSSPSGYIEWDVTDLVKGANGVGNGIAGFALVTDVDNGLPLRFTDHTPANDSGAAGEFGQAPELEIAIIPEPATLALLGSAGLLSLRRRRG